MTDEPVIVGTTDLQARLPMVRAVLSADGIAYLANLSTSRHRGWITADKPEGHEVTRISCHRMRTEVGQVVDDLRNGVCFEVFDHQRGEVVFYINLTSPEALVRSGVAPRYEMGGWPRNRLARDLWLTDLDRVPA